MEKLPQKDEANEKGYSLCYDGIKLVIIMKAKIKLIRVDNRLVHGQTGMSWTSTLDIDTIVVVDDEVVRSIFPQKLMTNIAKAANVHIRFYSVDDFMNVIDNESTQKLFIVVKTIQVARLLAEKGLVQQKLNIGNIHYEKGRLPFHKKMYLTKQDVDDLNYLNEMGYTIFYQDVPGTASEKIGYIDYDDLKRK